MTAPEAQAELYVAANKLLHQLDLRCGQHPLWEAEMMELRAALIAIRYPAAPPDPLALIRATLEAAAKECELELDRCPPSAYGHGMAGALATMAITLRNLNPESILAQAEGRK